MNAILLAAGLSIRFGRENKLLKTHNSFSIIHRTAYQLSKVKKLNSIVVLGHQAALIKKELSGLKLTTTYNADYASGMVSSIKQGLSMHNSNEAVMICMGDMPSLRSEDYQELIDFSHIYNNNTHIVRPRRGDQIGNPVIISSDLKSKFIDYSGLDSFFELFNSLANVYKPFDTLNSRFFYDIDTKEDAVCY